MKGRVWKVGDNIDTDIIIPGKYLNISDPKELGKHCMEGIDKEFPQKIALGDILVAGENFGCGSSREHAPLSIQAAGISCVIAKTFARIFYRNSINIGLPIIECPKAVEKIEGKDVLEIDFSRGKISNITKGEDYEFLPFPQFLEEMIKGGGLISYARKRLKEKLLK
jgi:3-isopropylmalate/(R)-2-methylmalate dehydratase small subunit